MKNRKGLVKILRIEIGSACEAWYECSDGHTYFESMYTFDDEEGDWIDPANYEFCW